MVGVRQEISSLNLNLLRLFKLVFNKTKLCKKQI